MSPEFKARIGQFSQQRSDGTGTIAQDAAAKSNEVQAKNRTRKQIARRFLSMKVKDPAAKDVAQKYGVTEEELEGLDYEELMFLMAVKTCVEEGRLKDLIDLYKLMGEYTETTKIEGDFPTHNGKPYYCKGDDETS